MERAIIAIHVGQAGVQIGNATWELFCLEHQIYPDGTHETPYSNENGNLSVFFNETRIGRQVPRALMIDTEPTVVDEIRTGAYRELFSPNCLLTDQMDAANNFARGYYASKHLADRSMQSIRKLAEACDGIQGFFCFNSNGGGTGAGFGSLLQHYVSQAFERTTTVQTTIMPSQKMSTAVVEPYNAVLHTKTTYEDVDVEFVMDNESFYNIIERNTTITNTSYTLINRIIAQIASTVTASLRFSTALSTDLAEYQTNLVPYPRIHFPVVCFAPVASSTQHDQFTVQQLTRACFDHTSTTLQCNMSGGHYMACCLLYRGDLTPLQVNHAIARIKSTRDIHFVDWCPTGFKVGITTEPCVQVPRCGLVGAPRVVTLLANSTGIVTKFEYLRAQYKSLIDHRAFVHWYVAEGMEEGEFEEASSEVESLISDYVDAKQDTTGQPKSTGEPVAE